MEQYHDPAQRARMLGSDGRGKWLRVDDIITDILKVAPGMTCVDLGCGAGAVSIPLAQAVGENGRVYAVDVNTDVLDIIRRKNPSANLVILQRSADDTGLEAGIADICVMVLFLHEVPPEGVLAEAYRLLKPGGRVLALEWRMDLDSPRPPKNERISVERMEQLMTGAGLTSFISDTWSESHYIAVAEKS